MDVEAFNLLFALLAVIADVAVVVFTVVAIAGRRSERAAAFRDAVWTGSARWRFRWPSRSP